MIECRSAQPNVPSAWVEVTNITDDDVVQARRILDDHLRVEHQPSDAIAKGFVTIIELCPRANPSDLWLQIVYRHLLALGWNDNKWKRVSGYALERTLSRIYTPRLAEYNLRMIPLSHSRAQAVFQCIDIDVPPSKADLFLAGKNADKWIVFGIVHVKASIAERIQDDVPASIAVMNSGLTSIILTMDAKCYPPPHGNCVNYGELGGRSIGRSKQRIKREYVEIHGQFDGLFSFNLRTPESSLSTASGKRIHTLSLNESPPDELVRFLVKRWKACLAVC